MKHWFPNPARPDCVYPTISLCLSLVSISSTSCLASHFLPFLTSGTTSLIMGSSESLKVITSLTLETLNFSTSDDNGNWQDFDRTFHTSSTFFFYSTKMKFLVYYAKAAKSLWWKTSKFFIFQKVKIWLIFRHFYFTKVNVIFLFYARDPAGEFYIIHSNGLQKQSVPEAMPTFQAAACRKVPKKYVFDKHDIAVKVGFQMHIHE